MNNESVDCEMVKAKKTTITITADKDKILQDLMKIEDRNASNMIGIALKFYYESKYKNK